MIPSFSSNFFRFFSRAVQFYRNVVFIQFKMLAPEWIASINISKSYGYQVLRGERTPGRDIILRTALALQLSLKETQRLLAVGDCGALYPKVRRDAAVIFALNQKMTLLETEDLLSSLPERSLFGKEI